MRTHNRKITAEEDTFKFVNFLNIGYALRLYTYAARLYLQITNKL